MALVQGDSLDKKIIFEGTQTKIIDVPLEKGIHLIEIEFISGWHVSDFSLTITSLREQSTIEGEKESDAFIQNVPIWYVGVYEPSQEKTSAQLPVNKGDVTLVLNSYRKTVWNISGAQGTKVVSIFLSSYNTGSEVKGVASTTKIIHSKQPLGVLYELYASCPSSQSFSVFYCDNLTNYSSIFKKLADLSGGNYIATFSGAYSTSSISLPQQVLSKDEESKLDAYAKKIKENWYKNKNTVN